MMRKATKNTRGPNTGERAYQRWIKESDWCIACHKKMLVICHHCYGATFKHNKVLIGHRACIGLCQYCDDIITHGSRRKFTEKFGPQSHLWWMSECSHRTSGGKGPPGYVSNAIMDWGK